MSLRKAGLQIALNLRLYPSSFLQLSNWTIPHAGIF